MREWLRSGVPGLREGAHMIAFVVVMLLQIAVGRLRQGRTPTADGVPPRAHFPFLVQLLIAGAIAAAVRLLVDHFAQ